jgi:uncharacterized protein
MDIRFAGTDGTQSGSITALTSLLDTLKHPFKAGDTVGIKLHWGERGNASFLEPVYARAIVSWLKTHGCKPFIFDTTVLYSGGRRTGKDSLETAGQHGYTAAFLDCPVMIADGMDGRDVIDLPAGYKHFQTVQVAAVVDKATGFFIFSHFKGHLASGFGGAIKNLSMGFASRAQKQRMHADVKPTLTPKRCTRCGVCVEVCPSGAAGISEGELPHYDLERCIGCAQCIAACPETALKILWNSDFASFQEKLVETAAAVWKHIRTRSVLINAVIKVSTECDCLPGETGIIAPDIGFLAGPSPLALDEACMARVGAETISRAHPGIPWQGQLSYARSIGLDT